MKKHKIKIEILEIEALNALYRNYFSREMEVSESRILSLIIAKLFALHRKSEPYSRLLFPCDKFKRINKRHYCRCLERLQECGLIKLRTGGSKKYVGYKRPTYEGGKKIKGECKAIFIAPNIRRLIASQPIRKKFIFKKLAILPPDADTTNFDNPICREVSKVFKNSIRVDLEALVQVSLTESELTPLEKVYSGHANAKQTKTGRTHHTLLHPYTKDKRHLYLIDGEKPVELDIVSAHFAILATKIQDANQKAKFLNLFEGEGFYINLAAACGIAINGKGAFKGTVQKAMCFKSYKKNCQQKRITDFFDKIAPEIRQLLMGKDEKPQAIMQRWESDLVNEAFMKCRQMGINLLPMADGFFIKETDCQLIRSIIPLKMEIK